MEEDLYLGTEIKHYQTYRNAVVPTFPLDYSSNNFWFDYLTSNSLAAIVRGDGAVQRDGSDIYITEIDVKGVYLGAHSYDVIGSPVGASTAVIFAALVLDTQSHPDRPLPSNVYVNPCASQYSVPRPLLNPLFRDRFVELDTCLSTLKWDVTTVVQPVGDPPLDVIITNFIGRVKKFTLRWSAADLGVEPLMFTYKFTTTGGRSADSSGLDLHLFIASSGGPTTHYAVHNTDVSFFDQAY